MDSVFVRSLALATAADARCITSASRTTGDGTFAVACSDEGVIRVYAASCAALLHEFSTIHGRVHALHYTSFSDSLVTLESDPVRVVGIEDENHSSDDEETFLCVYHDWREQKMVRGYTLPLGVLDSPGSRRKADCVAVCSFTGRVVVAMGSVLNIWQCSQGFFEHVMELMVDLSQHGAYHVLEYVAIHGIYVAYASSTEVRVLEIHVRHIQDDTSTTSSATLTTSTPLSPNQISDSSSGGLPEDSPDCAFFQLGEDMNAFDSIAVPIASFGEAADEKDHLHLHEKSMSIRPDHQPVVLGREEAQQEAWNLAGLIRSQDIRVNQAQNYHVGEDDVKILLQRFLPPNQRIRQLKFLPETIDNQASLEARSYTRLLVGTMNQAFLYYFLSHEADATRKKMSKKVLGTMGRLISSRSSSLRNLSIADVGKAGLSDDRDSSDESQSGRVVMHYSFTSPITSISANSSFLFVATQSSLQVWSIWSPCHHVAASRSLNASIVSEPAQSQLLSVQPLLHTTQELVALDSYVVLLPQQHSEPTVDPRDLLSISGDVALDQLPVAELELRGSTQANSARFEPSILIFQQSPPSTVLSKLESMKTLTAESRIDLLLSLFSLYRYRADVGGTLLQNSESQGTMSAAEKRLVLALRLETYLYDKLAGDCALALAKTFLARETRDLSRAAMFFVASSVEHDEVMKSFEELVGDESQAQVLEATHSYLEACLFPTSNSSAYLPGAANSSFQRARIGNALTRHVLSHYLKHRPEEFARLVIDSSLKWSLEDIDFAHATLRSSGTNNKQSFLITRLVLLLRAASFSSSDWEAFEANASENSNLATSCSRESIFSIVDQAVTADTSALVRLCVSHPELLVDKMSATVLAEALLKQTPLVLVRILEGTFNNAIARREETINTVAFCIRVVGATCDQSLERVLSNDGVNSKVTQQDVPTFGHAHAVLLRVLLFAIELFPRLHQLAENDEINEDEEALCRVERALAVEVLHLSVTLSSGLSSHRAEYTEERTVDTLTHLFAEWLEGASHTSGFIPQWELRFIETRCLVASNDSMKNILRAIFIRVLELVHDTQLIPPQAIVSAYEGVVSRDDGANDLATLLVLLSLPRVSRTVDGLRLITRRTTYVEFFLPYGRSYCNSLEEWRFLIQTLSVLSDNNTEADGVLENTDEVSVLESVLHHVSSTLGPEDLLEVLPDDGDLALYMATLEASVRLDSTLPIAT
ncbi:hypothetical protein Poli38472_005704 [Pythium oligandrum]|uniref:BLOC-2 complex member HPS3 N-terminal domain-containing protein n=1 Tax=Pythium oligandrum TaxID=41045 RepID=A0A8K1CHW7_PYTOL|nr:hypothetical protein Poli38472_005704 [Pythium oligandrum]|eukprot:TMW63086.1 hypothetical protein Poli38472_005704 [Pythium oligandrum]